MKKYKYFVSYYFTSNKKMEWEILVLILAKK